MSDLAEIKGLVEKINPTLVELRSDVDALKDNQPKDPITEAKWDAMLNGKDDEKGILGQMQEIQDLQAKMQAQLDRPGGGGDDDESKAQFNDFMRKGVDLDGSHHKDRLEIEVRAMSTDVNTDGGYLIRPEFADTIVNRVFETSPVRQIANIEQTGSKSRTFLIDDDEADANWVGEGAAGSETDTPEIGQKEIAAHKLEALPKITTEELEDAYIDVESWLIGKVSDKFARKQNTAFVTGDGVLKPRGFLTYAAWASAGVYERNKIEQINSGAAAAFTAEGLIDLQSSLKEAYQPGATFTMKRASYGAVLKLKGNDQFHFGPVLMRDGQAQMQLLGKPVLFMDDMPAVGAGNLAAAYGDFSRGYTVLDRVGVQILRDPYTAKGFITFYTTQRVGGDVTNYDALKIQKIAA